MADKVRMIKLSQIVVPAHIEKMEMAGRIESNERSLDEN